MKKRRRDCVLLALLVLLLCACAKREAAPQAAVDPYDVGGWAENESAAACSAIEVKSLKNSYYKTIFVGSWEEPGTFKQEERERYSYLVRYKACKAVTVEEILCGEMPIKVGDKIIVREYLNAWDAESIAENYGTEEDMWNATLFADKSCRRAIFICSYTEKEQTDIIYPYHYFPLSDDDTVRMVSRYWIDREAYQTLEDFRGIAREEPSPYTVDAPGEEPYIAFDVSECASFTQWLNQPEHNGLIWSEYEHAFEADLDPILAFYVNNFAVSNAEKEAYRAKTGRDAQRLMKISTDQLNAFTKDWARATWDSFKHFTWTYLESRDAWYAPDRAITPVKVTCDSGKLFDDGTHKIHYYVEADNKRIASGTLVVQIIDDAYVVCKNTYDETI